MNRKVQAMNAVNCQACLPFTMPLRSVRSWNPWSILAPLVVVALAGVAMASPELTASWELNRTAVADGQWWRLITGHLTHWNLDHLFWDAATFLALGFVCMRRNSMRTIACLTANSLAISVAVLTLHGDLSTYRGLSGLDTALFTLAAVMMWRDARQDSDRALAAVAKWALGGLLAKTAYELATGATLFVDSQTAGFVPLASAHAVGAVVGFFAAVPPWPIFARVPPQTAAGHADVLAFSSARAILRRRRLARAAGD